MKSDDSKGRNEKKVGRKKIQDFDKKIEDKRNEISSIKELMVKEELNESYLENDIKKTTSSLDKLKSKLRF